MKIDKKLIKKDGKDHLSEFQFNRVRIQEDPN